MKKISRSLICAVLACVLITALAMPAFAATNPKTERVSQVKSAWTESTELINWGDNVLGRALVESWVANETTDAKRSETLYKIVVDYIPYDANIDSQRSYEELLTLLAKRYLGEITRTKASMNEDEINILYTGMLRTVGISAYVEMGWAHGRAHSWVVSVISKTKYWSDPTWGIHKNSSTGTYWQLSSSTFNSEKYRYDDVLEEKKTTTDSNNNQDNKDDDMSPGELKTISVPEKERFDITLSFWKDGVKYSVTMTVFKYGNRSYMPASVSANVLGLWSGYNSDWKAATFSRDYTTSLQNKTVSHTAQAYMGQNAVILGSRGTVETTNSPTIVIDGTSFVCFEDVRDAIGSDVSITWNWPK